MYGNNKSKFVQHLLENKHVFGLREDIMDSIHVTKKRQNDGHIRKILHLQRDKIQQPNQRQANSQTQRNI